MLFESLKFEDRLITFYRISFVKIEFLRAKAAMLSARLSYRNSVRLSVRPSVYHTGGSGKNGPS